MSERRWSDSSSAGLTTRLVQNLNPRAGFVLLILIALTALGLWAGLTPIDVIVRAEGRVVPAGKTQIIQHLEGGIVRRIVVHEGQAVKAGELLMELSDIQAKAHVGQGKARIAALRGREARLVAESSGAARLNFPKDLQDAEVRRTELDAWQSRRNQVEEEVRVLRDQTSQKRAEIAEAQSRLAHLQEESAVAMKQYRVIDGLSRDGAASRMELLENESRVRRLQSQIGEAQSSLPRLRAAVSESDSRVSESWARYRAQASAELAEVRSDLEKSTLEIDTDTDRLARNQVRAPVSGFINRLAISTINGVVRPGETLMEITSDDQRVAVEARARPNDRANLRAGLAARVRLGAYDYAAFGFMNGVVREVSADTLQDDREGRYYRVQVEARNDDAATHLAITPGMTATVDIVVGRRTVLSYLLSPLMKFKTTVFRDPR